MDIWKIIGPQALNMGPQQSPLYQILKRLQEDDTYRQKMLSKLGSVGGGYVAGPIGSAAGGFLGGEIGKKI